MKFTNGYWLIRDYVDAKFATEYYSHEIINNELFIYVATKHIGDDRGSTLNSALLTLSLKSVNEETFRIKTTHFDGSNKKLPEFEKNEIINKLNVTENPENLIVENGNLIAKICKIPNNWGIEFVNKLSGEVYTNTKSKNIAYMHDKNTNIAYTTDQLLIDINEKIYGLGERFGNVAKNGQSIEMWNEDGGTVSEIAYKNIPFYLSTKNYGIFVDSSSDVNYEIATENVERVRISQQGESLTYYIFGGQNPKDVLMRYTDLLGKPALPPSWSFGLWLTTSFTTNYDEATVNSFIDGMFDRYIPISAFHFDCFWMKGYQWCDFTWDPDMFPNPTEMLSNLHKKNIQVCLWINSYIAQKGSVFNEAKKNGYLLLKEDGDVWQTDLWQAGMGIVDFTNPDAYNWYQDKLRGLMKQGVDCFKTDFAERIPVKGIKYFNGNDSMYMHNYYTYLYNKCVFEVIEEFKGKDEAVLFARSAIAGGQKFPVHWGGDCEASYHSMAESLRGGLSLSYCGFGFWSHDISGFERTATPDLYKRWAQFGLLSTHSRLHGSTSYRVPWNFDEEAVEVVREFLNLKNSLMPYIYSESVNSHKTGIPVLHSMQFEFNDDRSTHSLETQYMLGEKILVAPIFNEKGTVEYYLPKGKWTNYITNKVCEQGWHTETHNYFSLPVMVKENSVIPTSTLDSLDYNYNENLIFQVFELVESVKSDFLVYDQNTKSNISGFALKKNGKINFTVNNYTGEYTLILRNIKLLGYKYENNNTIIVSTDNSIQIDIN